MPSMGSLMGPALLCYVRVFGRGVRLRMQVVSRPLFSASPGYAGQCSPASLRVAKGCGNFGVGSVKVMDADEEQYD